MTKSAISYLHASAIFMSLNVIGLSLASASEHLHSGNISPTKISAFDIASIKGQADREPITLVVSLDHQNLDVYQGIRLVASSEVSSGKPGYETQAGVFSILEKRRHHRSNIYSGAPMPWMQRLTRSGVALHGGIVPGYPASHGCIRLPLSFAPELFKMTNIGEHVVIAGDRVAPRLIEHPSLFQPLRRMLKVKSNLSREETNKKALSASTSSNTINVNSGIQLAGTVAAEPHSDAPLHILVTRRTRRDRIIDLQRVLSSMGYLEPMNFDGTLGRRTARAIMAFQEDNGIPQTGAFTVDLVEKVYEVSGREKPPGGHLFVRQNFKHIFDTAVNFQSPDRPLGTHVFTGMELESSVRRMSWMAISVEGDNSAHALSRIKIPDYARQMISERLTPGSNLVIADKAIDSAILPDGDAFLVLARRRSMLPPADDRDATNVAEENGSDAIVRIYRGMEMEEIEVMRSSVIRSSQ